ncbi:MAG: DUF2793 domain-containing protein [Roseinatronobacter sp.]|nr:MAG: DUF2793 domain-containing protein [Roseinatronobacter sp.]
MSELSARLSLPFLQPAQAQKHVTHNEALELLDLLVQLSVEGFNAATPPVAAQDGQVWALGPAPGGEWAGQGDKLAARVGGAWVFVTPAPGWYATQGTALRIFDGGAWVLPDTGALQNIDGVGVGTSYDATNPLAVAGLSTLLTHSGAGHQLKINKNAAPDTASLLFQTAWSGRAEMGIAGNDDFAIKVSADGSAWRDGLRIDGASGVVSLPNGAQLDTALTGTAVVQSDVDTTAGRLLTTGAGPDQAYRRANILGAVSQSGGVPTGAVIERGSTANGVYVRFADGTQICTHTLNAGDPTAQGAGSFADPYRTGSTDWTYPAPFAERPAITAHSTVDSTDAGDRRMLASTGAATFSAVAAVQASRMSGSTGTAACMIDLVAIGRWF